MKSQLIAIVAAVLVVGCGESQPPELPTAKAPAISIHEAALKGNIEAVKQHIAAGTDVNAKDDIGTPLHIAAMFMGHKEIVEMLIAAGADVNAKEEEGYTSLDFAIINENTENADILLEHGGKSGAADSIQVAASVGNIEAVKRHLAAGVDVNTKSEVYVWTPLRGAAHNGHKEIAEMLIANGADVNAKNNGGQTPLDEAIRNDKTETADLLRKHGGKTAKELKAEGK